MKTSHITFKSWLAMIFLFMGVANSAWADEVTYTFASADWNATSNNVSANWTSGKKGAGFSNNGIQVTTGSTGANGTSPASFTNISKIVCTYNTNKSAGAGSIVAQIGNNTAITNSVKYSGSADGSSAKFTTSFTYAEPQSGNVKLTVNTTTNSIYLCSVTITYAPEGTTSVTEPKFSSNGGYVSLGTEIAITAGEGTTIHYTTNGNNPTENSTAYSAPIVLNQDMTIKAIAIDKDGNKSAVAEATYTVYAAEINLTQELTFKYGDFNFTGSGYQNYSNKIWLGSDKIRYAGWNMTDVLKSDGMQIKASTGKIVLPTIKSEYGFTVNVSISKNSVNIKYGATSVTSSYANKKALEINDTEAKEVTIEAGSTYGTINSITLTPIEKPKAITPATNNEAFGSVTIDGKVITATPAEGYRISKTNPYTVTSGAATVTQNGNIFTVAPTTDCTVQINFEAIPSHNVLWSINGTETTETALEDAPIDFPESPADIEDKTFVGWTTAAIDGETDEAPTFVSSATMGTEDQKFYAVFATISGGGEETATLTESDIKSNFSNEKRNYGTIVSYEDKATGVTWASSCNIDATGRPWFQIKKDATAYLKISANANISQIKLVLTSATNSSGGIADITKHTAFSGTAYLESSAKANPSGDLGSSNTITDNTVILTPNKSVTEVYIQPSAAARIWGGEVTYSAQTTSAYCTTIKPDIELAQPIVFHDSGDYEGSLTVAMAAEQGTIMYQLNDGETQTYTKPFTIEETTTVKAWATLDGAESEAVEKTFTIVEKAKGPNVEDGYYTLQTSEGKYVNVAGRKTVNFKTSTESAGTVIRVKATEGRVDVLRSQGVDLPGYAKRAMNYVPAIVQLVVDKLDAEGAGTLLGETGREKIMEKFDESFDYNLYLEEAEEGYRIYGRTPSMKPVVDFYAENKANVDAKLPELESFINQAIDKVLAKTGGRGANILEHFSLDDVWQRMGGTLTNPAEDQARFYEEVLSSETNVWQFAYQTAMLYWGNLKVHNKFLSIKEKLGDYAKYIDKVEYIRPNTKYYIVPNGSTVDFVSEGNYQIQQASSAWTMTPRTDFSVTFPEENLLSGSYYTTLYTDFAYTLPEGVKAYKVTAINEKTGVAQKEEFTGIVPAQTPVLLTATAAGQQTLKLTTEAGTKVTGNLLVGADYLINQYQLRTSQVESLFDMAKSLLGDNAYAEYLAKYEYLMQKNAGTVGNKYFFGLTEDDLDKCVFTNADGEDDCVVRSLSTDDEKPLGFYDNWQVKANQAFLVSETFNPVLLTLKGDVNRDGEVSIADVTALVNIILGKATPDNNPENYDFEAANVNEDEQISIADVTALVNIILGKQ